jgi:hypothetical protein
MISCRMVCEELGLPFAGDREAPRRIAAAHGPARA